MLLFLFHLVFEQYIYVIGGAEGPYIVSERSDYIDIIDKYGDIVLSEVVRLHEPIQSTSSILVQDRLYIFGGYIEGQTVDYWQYYDLNPLPTRSPTLPTEYPSMNPSVPPSETPTNYPTNDPTFDPTHNPTDVPTSAPTVTPTMQPTNITFNPTTA
eukprot:252075_1